MADQQSPAPFIQAEFAEALSQRYLAYALSTITSRSLPDVRDGLKPVHRRLLYAMRQLKLDPGQGYKKSARVVGDVMGKFHPHGDAAIYDAMVRLAQEFAMRYPLVDGQGNFGNIDGDNAAAMRYTEARMSDIAHLLLDGIDEDAVDFRATYDGEDEEPAILPAAFPNLLANGAQGIAVGMATSIPPHNILELCSAILHLIKSPKAKDDTLLKFVKGPDFPTGGVLIEDEAATAEAYVTGRGSFRVRAAWEKESVKGGSWRVVVHSIPYQVQKSRLVEKMAELLQARKLPMLADIRDESTEEVRLILEPKSRNIDADLLMESLFNLTDLETRVSLNLNVLDSTGRPGVLSLKEALIEWINHRQVVLQRRSKFRLGKIEARLEVLGGYLVVYLNLDEVIAIIREEDEPKQRLMERFKLKENQVNAILDMRLRSLRKLEEKEIRAEKSKLEAEKKELKALLQDEAAQLGEIAESVKQLKADMGGNGKRKTVLQPLPEAAGESLDMLVEKEPVTVICSKKGWIRAAKGHLADDAAIKYKEGDEGAFMFHAETTDRILVAADNGRFYTLAVDKLPGGRGFGEPVSLMVELGAETEIINVFPAMDGAILVAASSGHGFITEADQVTAQTRNGKQVLTLPDDVRARVARPAIGDMVAVVGENRKMLVFGRDELPVMPKGRGVLLQRYSKGGLSDARCFDGAAGLDWLPTNKSRKVEADTRAWQGNRGTAGKMVPAGFPKDPKFK